jgi:hypothetical protein
MVHKHLGVRLGRPARILVSAIAAITLLTSGGALLVLAEDSGAPIFTQNGALIRPADYREWVYVTSGLGMTYGTGEPTSPRTPRFDNVFVTRAAYREFLRSGKWPEKTMLILEVRRSEENVSINNGGRSQGEIVALEAAVKDRKRFPQDGWAYFSFDSEKGMTDRAPPLPATARCYSCHRDNAAVDNTFVQFYPVLFEAAQRHGTVKSTYDPNRKS